LQLSANIYFKVHLRLAVVIKRYESVYVQYAPDAKRSKQFSFKQAVQKHRGV